MMGAEYWWVVGLVLLINYLTERPALTLILTSPFVWAYLIFNVEKLKVFKEEFGNLKFIGLYLLSLFIAFLIYIFLKNSSKLFKMSNRYALVPILAVYLILLGIYLILKEHSHNASEAFFISNILIIFYASAFVMLAFDCLNSKRKLSDSVKSFFLLNTLNSTFLYYSGTQLGPNGTLPLLAPVRSRDQTNYLRRMAVKIGLLMVLLKVISDLIGYSFLGIDNNFFYKINIPQYEIVHMGQLRNLPRLYTDHKEEFNGPLHLAVFVRSINWYMARISIINFKILLLWMLGYNIKLGIDEPWKAKSFADFFRRTHVYIAHFYRIFVYPIIRPMAGLVPNKAFRKYLSVWLMIFVGGIIFQAVSHSYQLMRWSTEDIINSYKIRIIYDTLLASFIVAGLAFEKKKKNKNILYHSLSIITYLLIYCALMSISASIKIKGFSVEYLGAYFKNLILPF